jgi:polyisoprenoid-binding protein YceI
METSNYFKRLFSIGFGVLFLISALASNATPSRRSIEKKVNCEKSAEGVTFRAIGKPDLIQIVGKGAAISCEGTLVNLRKLNAEFKFSLESLDTGIALRNRHMKEKYLEIQRYPEAHLTIQDLNLTLGSPIDFEGTLTLHGVKRVVQGKLNLTQTVEHLTGEGQFEIMLTEFGIDIPSFAGITVSEKVSLLVPLKVRL